MRRRWVGVLAVALAVPAALVVMLALRLQAGPIRLPFLDRPIAAALGAAAPELVAEGGTTALARAGRGVALQVAGARLLGRDGTLLLSLPALAVRPSFGALVRGRLVIARVDVADAVLALTRATDGTWHLGSSGAPLAALAASGAPADGGRGAAGLPRIHLTRTTLTIDDQRSGGRFAIGDGDLLVSIGEGQLVVTVKGALDLASAVAPVPGRFRVPIRGEIVAPLSASGELGDLAFTLAGDAGEVAPAGDAGPPFALGGLAAAGTYHPAVETLRFARLAATVGTTRFDAKASVILGTAPMLAFDGTVDALTIATLIRLWPAELAPAVRAWLRESLRAGELRRCRVQLGLHGTTAPAAGTGATPPSAGTGTPVPSAGTPNAYDIACDFDGVTAEYLAPLDPIRAAAGSARLTPERLEVQVRSGKVGACQVDGGTLGMDLTVEPPRATIAADVSGTTAAVLALVDRPPLQLATPLGIVPGDIGGECRVHTEVRLPIKAGLAASAIGVRATANLRAASMANVAGGVGIADAELALTVDGARVTVTGTTALTGLADVTKPVTVALDVKPGAARSERRATLTLDGDGVTARATGTFAGGELMALAVERLRLGGSDVGGTLRRRGADRFEATLRGAMLDLGPLLADPRLTRAGASGTGASYAVTLDLARVRGAGGVDVRALRGTIQMSAARGDGSAARDKGSAARDNGNAARDNGNAARVDALMLTGTLAGRGGFRAAIEAGSGSRRVSVTSDDAGRFLSAFGGLEQIAGGSLVLDARTDARGPAASLEGTLVLRDFRLVRAPVLAKMLGIGSLGGVAALLNGDGMPFSEAHVPFRWDGMRLTLHDVRAIGAVGLTADGVFERDAATCEVRGSIIPAFSLNSALGKVPLIGRFLVGGKGEGVFGIDYQVTGRTGDPTVRVNPLTSVAPTVLRAWFIDPFRRR